MTIQFYGVIWFGGNTEKKIEEYFDNEKEAQAEWEKLYSKYENANCKTEIYAIKNEEDNVRPEKRYGASPYITGCEIGKMIIGKYA